MKIAIDLNDVIRDFSTNFLKYYYDRYNHEFALDDFEFWTNDMFTLFPFASEYAYLKFTYEEYVYELFGKCGLCENSITGQLSEWCSNKIGNYDGNEPIELMVVSPKEYGLSIGCTLFFLSKIGSTIRETYFPKDSLTIWDKCDVLITANPDLIEIKPEGKKVVKIKKEYNKDATADFEYSRFSDFLKDDEILDKLTEK